MKLAIYGGEKLRDQHFPPQDHFGEEERDAVMRVLDRGILSAYRGNYGDNFKGGVEVQALEETFIEYLRSTTAGIEDSRRADLSGYRALAVNSCTSAIQIACKAIADSPQVFDVTPWSMTCSASAPLMWGSKIAFRDIEPDFFCMDPSKSKNNYAIGVDLFGQPILPMAYAGMRFVEDAAQALGSYAVDANGMYRPAGTFGEIGCFSFTQGKHVTGGEGGMIVTKDPDLYERCALLRNHAEAVINDMDAQRQARYSSLRYGFNMRMTEIQAAIINQRIIKFPEALRARVMNTKIDI